MCNYTISKSAGDLLKTTSIRSMPTNGMVKNRALTAVDEVVRDYVNCDF